MASARLGEGGRPVLTLPDGTELDGPGPATDAALAGWLGRDVALVPAAGDPGGRAEFFADATDDSSAAIEWTMPQGRFVNALPLLLLTADSLRAGQGGPRRRVGRPAVSPQPAAGGRRGRVDGGRVARPRARRRGRAPAAREAVYPLHHDHAPPAGARRRRGHVPGGRPPPRRGAGRAGAGRRARDGQRRVTSCETWADRRPIQDDSVPPSRCPWRAVGSESLRSTVAAQLPRSFSASSDLVPGSAA